MIFSQSEMRLRYQKKFTKSHVFRLHAFLYNLGYAFRNQLAKA